MIYAKKPYLLHLLAGSSNISALDAAKALLDSGEHNPNECEPDDNLSVLHVAAAWDNLAMCQLLVHYGADVGAIDSDGRRPVDVAVGRSRKFLKKFRRKHRKERNKIAKIFSFVFGRACLEPKNLDASTFSPYKPARRSCPTLPTAPPLQNSSTPSSAKDDAVISRKTSTTSSYVTAKDALSCGDPTKNGSTGSVAGQTSRQRTISGNSGSSMMRLSLFSNVTLRRGKGAKEDEPKQPLRKSDQFEIHKSQEKLDAEPRERLRSSLSIGTTDRDYLSSDHTTPRHSNLKPRRVVKDPPDNRRGELKFSSSCRSERLKSFGPHNNINIYPDLSVDLSAYNISSDQGSGKATSRAEGNFNQNARPAFERPYNETLSEVAAGLAALDFGDSETFEESRIREELSSIGLDDLRKRLREKKCSIGPISVSNRRLYEGKLARIELNIRKGGGYEIAKYSQALQQLLRDNDTSVQQIGEAEEHELRQHFQSPVASRRKEVACFCYLLIDPSMIPDFQRCSFQEFVNAIFYVGKGTGSRPFSHLIDACNLRRAKIPKMSEKVKRILDLWDRKLGVISLSFCQNIHADEALIRETCMIETIGIENLTNIRRGKVTGLPTMWTHRRITELGASLLRKAHAIIIHERCRPIMEEEVAAMSPYRPFAQRR